VSDIADKMCISERTVCRYLAKFNTTGEVKFTLQNHGPSKLLGEYEQLVLLEIIASYKGIYLAEIQSKLEDMYNVHCSIATICRTLKFMGCSRQVIQKIDLHRSDDCRAEFMAKVSMYEPEMLVWIDESGCDKRNSFRKYAYSMKGLTPQDHRFMVRGTRYSAIPVLSTEGIHDVCLFEGSVNGDRMQDFVINYLLPILKPFNWSNSHSVVVMDNASIHHVQGVVDLIENHGSRILFLPPYSPDLNPLEEVFSQAKSIMKANDCVFQSCTESRVLLLMAFDMVTVEDCNAYIAHSGYQ